MRNEIITLIIRSAQGAEIVEEKINVFAGKKSVTRSEFYGAYQVGLNPKYVFVMDSLDYEMTRRVNNSVETYAQEIEYNGATFAILRTYDKGTEIELTVG